MVWGGSAATPGTQEPPELSPCRVGLVAPVSHCCDPCLEGREQGVARGTLGSV